MIHWQVEAGTSDSELDELLVEDVWVDSVEGRPEVYKKKNPDICPWMVEVAQDEVLTQIDCILCRPAGSVSKLQGVQHGVCDQLALKGFYDHRCQS